MYIFVDVGMFYKSAHNFLYKAWGLGMQKLDGNVSDGGYYIW